MEAQPALGDFFTLGDDYRVAEHPAAPGLPYAQQGSESIVYQLFAARQGGRTDRRALKLFKPPLRQARLAAHAQQVASLADIPGLRACRRLVLTPGQHADLLRRAPELTYALVMPWIDGPTWSSIVADARPLSSDQTLQLGLALARVLVQLEQRGLAHGDITPSNVLLPDLESVELVDLETLSAAGEANSDRGQGAFLLAQILTWSDPRVRAAGPDPGTELLIAALREAWGAGVANLWASAASARTLAQCPPLREWLRAIEARAAAPASETRRRVEAPVLSRSAGRISRRVVLAAGGALATVLVLGTIAGVLLLSSPAPAPPLAAEALPTVLPTVQPGPTLQPTSPPPQPTAASVAAQPTPAEATPQPTSGSTAAQPTPASTEADAWQAAESSLDATWGKDWAAAIGTLEFFRQRFPNSEPAQDKLYAALVEYGKALLDSGRTADGVVTLSRARELDPDRAEAPSVLVALTPTAPPAPPAPAPPAPPAVVRARVAPQAAPPRTVPQPIVNAVSAQPVLKQDVARDGVKPAKQDVTR